MNHSYKKIVYPKKEINWFNVLTLGVLTAGLFGAVAFSFVLGRGSGYQKCLRDHGLASPSSQTRAK
jgi:hypothetical protein